MGFTVNQLSDFSPYKNDTNNYYLTQTSFTHKTCILEFYSAYGKEEKILRVRKIAMNLST